MAALVRGAAAAVVGLERVRHDDGVRTMAAEDFSEFSIRVPGCYFFVGARDEGVGAIHPHHSPRFNICEKAMSVGLDVLEASATTYLAAEA